MRARRTRVQEHNDGRRGNGGMCIAEYFAKCSLFGCLEWSKRRNFVDKGAFFQVATAG